MPPKRKDEQDGHQEAEGQPAPKKQRKTTSTGARSSHKSASSGPTTSAQGKGQCSQLFKLSAEFLQFVLLENSGRPTRVNAGQGGRAAQLRAVAEKIAPARKERLTNNIPAAEPVNDQAPKAPKKRASRKVRMPLLCCYSYSLLNVSRRQHSLLL